MFSLLAAFLFAAAPAEAAPPPAQESAAEDGIVVFHDIPFVHPVTLLLRAVDVETGAFGDVNLLVTPGEFAAGRGMLKAAEGAGTVKEFHAAELARGAYAMIGKIERIPDGDQVKIWTTCYPKGAQIFTVESAARLLVETPTTMTFDPALMQTQIEQYLKADSAQMKKDFAAILAANPSFAGDYREEKPATAVSFKMAPSGSVEAEECIRPGKAKGKIIPYTAPGAKK
jgi:hypothetical protein